MAKIEQLYPKGTKEYYYQLTSNLYELTTFIENKFGKYIAYDDNLSNEEKINKVSLIAFTENDIGNAFWNTIGWTERLDLNYYDFTLNEENITAFNGQ